ncbi:swarming motility protein SwrB [Weizmannia acidilactici]|uniref:Swarming motility protein SwrB n=1 Tax=Weizmannia acidilactici TaxID=2607726 RepID=A0A5J4JB88_9BACI|nr:hypothetical protein [Weizmannia acidilactici]GER65649.1 swarming motility protein SwrB [Weizmannia acidilactici]GER69021.1 swarming motility protein SwrB [Weizmannia acidilactici]GER72006.1 swarming motility protein SwrB [Weizmannia acidilactici]
MVAFLLALSFLLNVLSIFAIILLYLRQNRTVQAEENYNKMVKEIEEIFAAYLLEMKEENDAFIRKVKAARTADTGSPRAEGSVKQNEPPGADGKIAEVKSEAFVRAVAGRAYRKAAEPPLSENMEQEGQDDYLFPESPEEETSLFQKVNELQKIGYNVEEIAQKLNIGRTEIELLLKFHSGLE